MSLLGLVADYSSDSDNSTSNQDNDIEPVALKGEMLVKAKSAEGRNLLEMEDSSSEDDDEEKIPSTEKEDVSELNHQRLPNPLLDKPTFDLPFQESRTSETAKFSVFTNQYREAEKAKHQILEKHVKMTENFNIQNKQVCWKFRKGKCRFGKNCKYSHDLGEISMPDKTPTNADNTGNSMKNNNNFSNGPARVVYGNQQDWLADSQQPEQDDDSYMGNMKRKRRAGINDSLLPSKKALLPLEQQRANERPWTVKSKR